MFDVMVYAGLELFSLLVIGFLIQRKLGLSVLHLLSFVLDCSWRMVHSNLIVWIFFTLESSIEHSGNCGEPQLLRSQTLAHLIVHAWLLQAPTTVYRSAG
jgi:hypothetical protein